MDNVEKLLEKTWKENQTLYLNAVDANVIVLVETFAVRFANNLFKYIENDAKQN